MENKILQTLCKLKGVKDACIYEFKGDHPGMIANSFDEEKTSSIISAVDIIEQIISALQAINKNHDEIYFSLENEFIAAYLMSDRYIAILLTEKRINFPLIHMGIRSASKKIQSLQQNVPRKTSKITGHQTQPQSNKPPIESPSNTPISPDISAIQEQLQRLLLGYLGPAAPIVCNEAIHKWKATYVPNRKNLKYLIQIIGEELDDERDQQNFTLIAQKIYK